MSASTTHSLWTGPSLPMAMTQTRVLAVLLLAAAVLRLAGLDGQPLWADEAATAGFASLPWSELLHGVGRMEPNPPGFYLLESLWTSVAGGSDFALRLPSVVFGVGGVAVVWVLARAAAGSGQQGARAAAWAAGLAAGNVLLLEHARDARVYALFFLTIGLVALLGRRIATCAAGTAPWCTVLALAAVSALAFWLHHTAAIAVGAAYAYAGVMAVHRPGPRLHRLAMLVVAGLAGLVLGLPALLRLLATAADKGNNAGWIPVPDVFMATMFMVTTWTSTLDGLRLFAAPVSLAGLAAGLVVIAFVLVRSATQVRRSADIAGLLAAAVLSIVVMAGVSQVVPVMVEKTLLFSLVFFLPLLGCAMAALPRAVALGVLVVLLLLQAPGAGALYAGARHGEDWAGAAAAIEAEAARADTAVVLRSGFDALALERYTPGPTAVRASMVMASRLGTALNEEIALRLTGATALSDQTSADRLCGRLGQHEQVLLIDRSNAVMARERQVPMALLMSAGGMEAGVSEVGSLVIQRWRGVCATGAPADARTAALPRPPRPSAGN